MPTDRPPDEDWQYGSHRDQVADVYLPPEGERGLTSIVFLVHGGFWRPAYDRIHIRPLATALADRGHVVVSIDYRREPGHPDSTTDDVRSAFGQLVALRSSLRLADGPVQLVGHSAGGHLALWLAGEDGVDATAVALAPVADLRMAESLGLGGGAVAAFLGTTAQARPDLDPVRRAAPARGVVVIHGELDDTVPLDVSASYVQAFGSIASMRALPGCGHFEPIDPTSSAWPVLVGELDRLALPPTGPGAAGIE